MADSRPLPSDCAGGGHPLEIIPFFRRSVPRDIVYTAIWNSLFAIFFTLVSLIVDRRAPLGNVLGETFVFAQCIGYLIHGGLLLGDRIVGASIQRAGLWVRVAYYATIPSIAIFPGHLLASRSLNRPNATEWLFSPRMVVSIVAASLILTAVMLLIFLPRERAARAEAMVAREQARVASAEKEATTARMKLLEAQVEPHFLYNTLAHVVSLIDGDPRVAKRMTERLIALLRGAHRDICYFQANDKVHERVHEGWRGADSHAAA